MLDPGICSKRVCVEAKTVFENELVPCGQTKFVSHLPLLDLTLHYLLVGSTQWDPRISAGKVSWECAKLREPGQEHRRLS